MHEIHGMYIVDRSFYRNRTVRIIYRMDDETPLYKSMMNATQSASVTLPTRTTTDPEVAMQDGTTGKVHRPTKIRFGIVDRSNNTIGSFEIDPESANKYRHRQFSANVFAENVVDSLHLEQDVERGDQSPGWYLNRSQLYDWAGGYIVVLRKMTDPSKTVCEKEFPVHNVTIKPGEIRIHHEMVWDDDEMGQAFISAQADMYTAYRKTTNASWAMAPQRLSHYLDRPGLNDIRAHMDLESVYWIIIHRKNNTNLNAYLNKDESEVIDDE